MAGLAGGAAGFVGCPALGHGDLPGVMTSSRAPLGIQA